MTLRPGDRGGDVKELQRCLGITADGIFGVDTKAAVMEYQRKNGLVPDGYAGPKTMDVLYHTGCIVKAVAVDTTSPFVPMSSIRRSHVFGAFTYERTTGDNVRILGNWETENIVRVFIPQLNGVPFYSPDGSQKCNGYVRLHKLAGPIFQRFFAMIEQQGLLHLVRSFDGAYVPRYVRGSKTSLSNHSWGTAIDINCYANGLGKTPAKAGQDGYLLPLVPLGHACGLYWGGNFSRRDGMHWEVAIA